jgi:hypothetical protein
VPHAYIMQLSVLDLATATTASESKGYEGTVKNSRRRNMIGLLRPATHCQFLIGLRSPLRKVVHALWSEDRVG